MKNINNVTVPQKYLFAALQLKLSMFPKYLLRCGTKGDCIWHPDEKPEDIICVFYKGYDKGKRKLQWIGNLHFKMNVDSQWEPNDHINLTMPDILFIASLRFEAMGIINQ